MSELRKDPIVDRWVVIANERGQRPNAAAPPKKSDSAEACPFCAGREGETPPEVLAYRDASTPANSPGWTVRVVPNKYPAVVSATDCFGRDDGFYRFMDGVGVHEVIIESPHHCTSMAELSETQVEEVLHAYRERIAYLQKDPRWQAIVVYKNQGSAAGATLEHVHSQLLALPMVPRELNQEWRALLAHHKFRKKCLYCEILDKEHGEGLRVVVESPAFIAFCPFASRFPFEIWVMPREHSPFFHTLAKHEIEELASMLRRCLQRLDDIVDTSVNYVIHSGPLQQAQRENYHWHLEILPRISKIAGFELASGYYINTVAPELAARQLRDVAR